MLDTALDSGIMWIVIGVAVVVFLAIIAMYNSLVARRVETQNAWSQIDVQLKRRYDLIPNLVETVKGYAKHESGTLERIVQARNQALTASSVADKAAAEGQLSIAIKGVIGLAEAYPDLKANQNFLSLQSQLAETENQISFARQYYNDAVATLNKLVRTLPWNLFTAMAGVHQRDFYEAPAGQDQAPTVKF
jgi:LemA protein